MIIFLAAVCCTAWLYLIAFHGRFWSSGPVLREDKTFFINAKVAVVVPARDEAENIGRSLSSLLAQEYRGQLSIILVDDNSTDSTAKIAASLPNQGRLTIVSGQALPAGWSGKLWAVHQGLMQPEAQNSDYILLTDADIEHASTHVATLVYEAEINGQDLVSEMVRLHCSTPAERALIPAFIFFFQMLYPFAWVADPGRAVAGAAGGTMLIRRTALERIDGVHRIRHHLIDDCALALQIKSSGGKTWLGHAELARSLRVYADWREVWNMIARTAYVQLGHSPFMLLGCVAGMGLLYMAPVPLTLFGHGLTRALAAAAWLMMAIAFQPTLRRYGRSPLWGALLPGIAMFYLGATVASAFHHHMGRGGGWKNRTYPEAPSK
ncbi:glycosyltransferase [Terriglobus albidus]|uniref:glycosyltransferase n=1 Tax=Terriglobus albidus TaxID=1592106 RepID=UPI0021DF43AD|nr:glycosyltransferase [Terriglobus albidus]